MKYTSVSIISAAALSLMGGAASAESLEPQHSTAENTPVLAQIDNPVKLTDSEMEKITAGAWVSAPATGEWVAYHGSYLWLYPHAYYWVDADKKLYY